MKKPEKKAELSINFIIVMVIALIVLVVMIYIFSTNATKGNEDLSGCASKGGQCRDNCLSGEGGSSFFSDKSCDENQLCCIPLGVDKNN